MGHIFISYSHKDMAYARKLQCYLLEQGFEAWLDDRIDYGTDWPQEIKKRLQECAAFVLIMSPASEESEWVQNELNLARKLKKPLFPLLLDGEAWWHLGTTQFANVCEGQLPDTKFCTRLAEIALPKWPTETFPSHLSKIDTTSKPPEPAPTGAAKPNRSVRIEIIVALIGLTSTFLAALINVLPWKEWLAPAPTPTVTQTILAPAFTSTPNAILVLPTATFASSLTPTKTHTPTATPLPLPTEITDDKSVKMRLVPAGEFTMGKNADDALAECQKYKIDCQDYWFTDEAPPHQVTLSSFYMDVYEVTNVLYRACVKANACKPPVTSTSQTRSSYYGNPKYDNYPVIHVNWNMAKTYCEWRGARLPTEAEWEKAARGTDGRTYPWGEGLDKTFANYNQNVGDTTAVGSYPKGVSPYGMYDMAGNVWEWVADWYDVGYYGTLHGKVVDPQGPESGQEPVVRSGSWYYSEDGLRTSNRGGEPAVSHDGNDGFRCARTP